MKTKPLTQPVIRAAERLFDRAYDQTLDFTKLREIVQSTPLAVWREFATFHVEERIEWGDETPDSTSFIATLNGCEPAQIKAAALLLLLRGEHVRVNASKTKVKYHYRLLLAVENSVNSLHGWLDCETGKLQTVKGWPGLMAAMAAMVSKPESGVRA